MTEVAVGYPDDEGENLPARREPHEIIQREDDEVLSPLGALSEDVVVRAEKAIPLVVRAKKAALGVTNPRDWCAPGGKDGQPYLCESGAMKVASIFGVSFTGTDVREVPVVLEGKRIIRYIAKVTARFGRRSLEVEGITDSEDDFFRFRWLPGPDGQRHKTELPLAERDLPSIRKKAVTNALNRALKKVLGLGTPTWEDLAPHGITPQNVGAVEYKSGSGKKPSGPAEFTDTHKKLREMILEMAEGDSERAGEMLEQFSGFQGKDGNWVNGKTRVDQLTEGWAKGTLKKVEKEYGAWKAKHGQRQNVRNGQPAPREPGEDDQ